MKRKLLIILLTIFTLFYASCAKAKTLGTGVSVDNEGNLIINAPLYTFDRNGYGEKLKIEHAPSSINNEIYVCIFKAQNNLDYPLEFKGKIKNGYLSLTIKKPDENYLIEAMKFWVISEIFFTDGADVKIGQLDLSIKDDDISRLLLYPNRNAQILHNDSMERYDYYIDGDHCEIIYSFGEVNISGKVYEPELFDWWHGEFNLHLKQGWNIVSTRYYYDNTLKGDVYTLTSIYPSKDAVWVMVK